MKYLTHYILSLTCTTTLSLMWGCGEITTDLGESVIGGSEVAETVPLIDSNTNWLLSCVEDTDCGEGERCSCGSCVIPCEMGRGCRLRPGAPQPPQVECAMVAPVSDPDSCGEETSDVGQICLPRCELTQECPADLICHEGTCKLPRRGQRACEEARRCVEGGGDPEECLMSCPQGEDAMSRPPRPPEEVTDCARRCLADGNSPEDCERRCM